MKKWLFYKIYKVWLYESYSLSMMEEALKSLCKCTNTTMEKYSLTSNIPKFKILMMYNILISPLLESLERYVVIFIISG